MEPLRHTFKERKNGFKRENIHILRRDVTRETGFVLLPFRLKDLTLRLEVQGNNKSLNVQVKRKEEVTK